MRWRRVVPLLSLIAACSTIGDPGGMPDGLPHGGTGAFRLLDAEEIGIVGSLPGRAMVLRDAVERATPVDGYLFYATARVLDEPPPLPDDQPPNDIFWAAFEPRRIHRGEAREEGFGGFASGPEVLVASDAWEGGEVFDPFVVVDGGTARLYYAGLGGIGLAEAPDAGGTFTRVGAAPIVADARHPSVVRGVDGAWWMYYEAAGAIHFARSDDGRAFTPMGPITLSDDDTGEGTELRVASPGAVRVETRGDRTLIRLYFESVREGITEGELSHVFYVAGSEDGVTFERYPIPVMEQSDVRFPAPVLVDDRVTLLYGNLPFFGGAYLTRAVVAAVGPGGYRFAAPSTPSP
ncbi:MAG: hypothetical protein H6719_18260 [Sandaracinaceae bacterium]|nr:hypothetical protein [Sandaracinaceae bacterium]